MDYRTLNLLFRYSKEFSHKKIRSQDDVSIALKIEKTTVGKALAALEKRNCIVRLQDNADRRIKRLKLTESGKCKVSELVNLHDNWLSEIMTCLTTKEQKQFESFCDRLLIAAEKLTNGGN